ncbi:hypothetical protein BDQ12DRAFT_372892 [Crucibulum laeve]|uniref:Uncharacterized protein n=1 Tax=Crucibulum laeve TaxID=68775 RepID=A0A5C3LPU8_9AGAR|nr:hypothetical protein BDQ12DRAFT_372892 [Crucibulum laeve]
MCLLLSSYISSASISSSSYYIPPFQSPNRSNTRTGPVDVARILLVLLFFAPTSSVYRYHGHRPCSVRRGDCIVRRKSSIGCRPWRDS